MKQLFESINNVNIHFKTNKNEENAKINHITNAIQKIMVNHKTFIPLYHYIKNL